MDRILDKPPRWQPQRASAGQIGAKPGHWPAMLRGWRGRCPNCGRAPLFAGWLRQVDVCAVCDAPLGSIRADDAPPYFVVFIVGHLVIGLAVLVDGIADLSVAAEIAIFLPLTAVLALALLRPVKGALIGLMLQMDMLPRSGD